jgi:aminoglycoside phosphotransferase (APT) family kinase protein
VRRGGLLDGFPLHLLCGGSEGECVVVLDAAELGRLALDPVPGGRRRVLAVAREHSVLARTRAEYEAAGDAVPLLVRADPDRLPFAAGSLGGIVLGAAMAGPGADLASRFGELLAADGWLAELLPIRPRVRPAAGARGEAEHTSTYHVRPASGREYFATRSWRPRRWPFRALPLGRLRRLRLELDLVCARLGLRPLCDGVRVRVHARGPAGIAESWAAREPGSELALFAKARWNALLIGSSEIGKLPLIDVAADRMADHAAQLRSLAQEAPAGLARLLPRVLHHERHGGQELWVEARLPGCPSTRARLTPGFRQRKAAEGVSFLIALHRATARRVRVERNLFEAFAKPRLARIGQEARRLDAGFDPEPLAAALLARLAGRELPLVRSHGDFWSGNVLVDARGALTGVLDWDASAAGGWPGLDLFHLLAFQHKRRAFWRFGATVTQRLAPRRLARFERALARRYWDALELDDALWTPLVALYWVERVAQWLVTDFHEGKRDDRWLARNVVAALPELLARLRS